jgi:hypothetical protein
VDHVRSYTSDIYEHSDLCYSQNRMPMRKISNWSITACSMVRQTDCKYKLDNIRSYRYDVILTSYAAIRILDAGNEGSINTFVVCQALTYGLAEGPLPSLGVGYKILIGNAKSVGFVPYVGDGSAVLSVVSLTELFLSLSLICGGQSSANIGG